LAGLAERWSLQMGGSRGNWQLGAEQVGQVSDSHWLPNTVSPVFRSGTERNGAVRAVRCFADCAMKRKWSAGKAGELVVGSATENHSLSCLAPDASTGRRSNCLKDSFRTTRSLWSTLITFRLYGEPSRRVSPQHIKLQPPGSLGISTRTSPVFEMANSFVCGHVIRTTLLVE
jgi:hypothetical protein